jgi:hypothetical protein
MVAQQIRSPTLDASTYIEIARAISLTCTVVLRRITSLRRWVAGLALVGALAGPAASRARADRIDDLAHTLESDPSWRVRLQAVAVMGKLGDARAVPALIRALGDPNETVRGLAAQVLGDLGGSSAVSALERSRRDSSAFVRDKASAALVKLQPSRMAAAPAAPGATHIEVGSVGLKAKGAPPEMKDQLRTMIERELAHTAGVTMAGPPVSGFRIDGSITNLSRKTTDHFDEISCEVSLIIGKLPDKAMVMMTSGGATVQAPRASGLNKAQLASLERDALEGAVKGAHENVLTFLRTQQPPPTAGRAGRR